MSDDIVRWPRVQQLLTDIMQRWEGREKRRGLPGIHGYYWDTPQELANDEAMGLLFIEPEYRRRKRLSSCRYGAGSGAYPKCPWADLFSRKRRYRR